MAEEPLLGSHYEDEDLDDVDGMDDVEFAVKLTGVSRVYKIDKHEIRALDNVSLEILPGDFVVISGHSGSGKTTLLNLVGSIDHASEGRVLVMDVPIGDYDESFRATFRLSNTGYIFQSYNLISTLTAMENVMFPMQLSEKSETELRDISIKLLERVGLGARLDHLPWQLSSGEQQRVAIARAMANDPSIILADEPTANLDEESAQMVRDLLRELNQSGKTLMVMTHDSEIISIPGVRHLRMSSGALIEDV
ncbi:MAG: ABC transporter ATP-binding protein [Candidatus Thorarchaeota archaeon]